MLLGIFMSASFLRLNNVKFIEFSIEVFLGIILQSLKLYSTTNKKIPLVKIVSAKKR